MDKNFTLIKDKQPKNTKDIFGFAVLVQENDNVYELPYVVVWDEVSQQWFDNDGEPCEENIIAWCPIR